MNAARGTLGLAELAAMLGEPASALSEDSRRRVEAAALSYEELAVPRRDQVILQALRAVESDALKAAGSHRKADWEAGWAQNLEAFSEDADPARLVPRYFRPDPVLRIQRSYVRPDRADFLPRFHALYCRLVFERFLADASEVWEFGCGTGHNLVNLTERFPDKPVVGLDWAASAVNLVQALEQQYPNVRGRSFDFFHPDPAHRLPPGAAALTIHALEQIGGDFRPFLDYLLEQRPALCVHVEPIVELYDEDNLLDHLAARYHRRRKYLEGFLPALRELEAKDRIRLEFVQRAFVGSEFDEGYTLVVWRMR